MVAPLPVKEYSSVAEMQAAYAASRARVWYPEIKKRVAISRNDNRFKPISENEILRMRTMRAAGGSLNDIAKSVKRDFRTVQKLVGDIAPPEGGFKIGRREPKLPRAKALRMRRAGFTYEEIAEDLGVNIGSAWRLVNGEKDRRRPHTVVKDLLDTVSKVSGLTYPQIGRAPFRAGRPSVDISRARHLLFWLVRRDRPDLSLPKLGKALGGFDHTSCMYGIWRVTAVVAHYGIDGSLPASDVARLIWDADWSAVTFARKAA